MNWSNVPKMGIGQRWNGPQDEVRLKYLGQGINYLEPTLPLPLESIPKGVPLIAHSSELAIASTGELNQIMFDCIKNQIIACTPNWAGEHFTLVSPIETGEIGYNFSPILDKATLEATIKNVQILSSAYKCPVALECGPRYFPFQDRWDDHSFLVEISEATGCGIIFDLSHYIVSMLNLKKNIFEGISEALLLKIVEIHVTGIGKHNNGKYHHDCHSSPVPKIGWDLLESIIHHTPLLKGITLEHDETVLEEDYRNDISRLNSYKLI